jgi:hypothetical protein
LNYSNIANPIASPSVTTTYTLTVTNATGQCASTDQVTVFVNPLPVAPVSISVDRTILCNDDNGNIVLTAVGGSGTTLNWYEGSCNSTVIGSGNTLTLPSPNATTTYYASWENSCGSSSCASLIVPVPDAIVVSENVGTIACTGNSTSLSVTATGGSSPFLYSLNGGPFQAGNTFTVNAAGSPYIVTVKDANNCLAESRSIVLTNPMPIVLNPVTV